MGLLDAQGRHVGTNRGGRIHPLLRTNEKVFEGVLNVKRFDDAIEGVGECFWCRGKVGAVVRFDPKHIAEHNVTDVEIRKKLYDLIQERHQCGARLHDGKDDIQDFLRRFE